MSTLLTNLTLVPMDGPVDRPVGRVRRGSIRVRGGRIVALGDLGPEPGEAVVDGRGRTAVPGFVQTHLHFCQTLFRGLADDRPLLAWLRERIWPLEAAHDAASVRASAELSIVELLRGGTTTVQVMETVRYTEETFDVAAAAGVTAIVGNCLMDRAGPDVPGGLRTSVDEALRISEQLLDGFHGRGRLHYAVSPRFILSCSDELSHRAAEFAAAHGLRIHSHAAEHGDEVAAVVEERGKRYVHALREQGLLGPRTGLAHCVHVDDDEVATLGETDTAVLHCPSTNLKLGSGIARIADLETAGLRIGLGADGAPCNNRLSALTEMRQAALLQSVARGPGAWPAERALFALTRGGARALGLEDEIGSLAPGRRADIVLLDLDAPHLEPGGDVVSKLCWSASDADVGEVWVGGERAVEDGQVVRFDGARVAANARAQRDALLSRAGLRA